MSGLVRSLTDGEAADVGTVGGKAASLMALAGAGFPVPGGAVLTTAFFEPWFAELRETTAWQALVDAGRLDHAEHVLDLTLEDLEAAEPLAVLRSIGAAARMRFRGAASARRCIRCARSGRPARSPRFH